MTTKWYEIKTTKGKVVDARKFSPKGDSLEKEIKRAEVAAQTPFEKGKRRKRIYQTKQHKVS